jgi:DnaJ-class molecular chaperone
MSFVKDFLISYWYTLIPLACLGLGWLAMVYIDSRKRYTYIEEEECADCGGSGVLTSYQGEDFECERCWGLGKVEVVKRGYESKGSKR